MSQQRCSASPKQELYIRYQMTYLRIANPCGPKISELAYLTPLSTKSAARSSAIHVVTVEGTGPVSLSDDPTTSKQTKTLPELQCVQPDLLKQTILPLMVHVQIWLSRCCLTLATLFRCHSAPAWSGLSDLPKGHCAQTRWADTLEWYLRRCWWLFRHTPDRYLGFI